MRENGIIGYTINILNQQNQNEAPYFENLHIAEINGVYEAFILKWTPDNPYEEFSIANYSGKMSYYDVNYDLIKTKTVLNGIITDIINGESGGEPSGLVEENCFFDFGPCTICNGELIGVHECNISLFIDCGSSGGGGGSTGGTGGTVGGGGGSGAAGSGSGGVGGSSGTSTTTGVNSVYVNGDPRTAFLPIPTIYINLTWALQLTPEQQEWINNSEQAEIKATLQQYIAADEFSTESKEFAKELINASMTLDLNAVEVWDDYDNFRNQMSTSERDLFDNLLPNRKLWYMCSAKKARDESIELFPANSLRNGRGDAFRHALWNGLCALTLPGNLGEQLTTANENKPSEYTYNYKETEMDLYNNEKGRQIAIFSNLTNIVDNILLDLNNGYLRYLNNLNPVNNEATYNSILIPTDQ